ncbi:MAG: DUF4340 domain-containing protein [Treponema sp.]|nr:DUF4340 domain-containing protein [Treponema sp.]
MTYKNKLICLLSLIGVLVLSYIGSFIFDYNWDNARSATFVWLDSKIAQNTSKIVIKSFGQEFEIEKINSQWYITFENNVYPARQSRIDDFLRIFTTRSQWPLRASSVSSHENFGLDQSACRVTIYGEHSVILDLLIGDDDFMGKESYFRKAGHNEVRSGDSSIRAYLTGAVTSWYNLRLIPESDGGFADLSNVQRLTVYGGAAPDEVQRFTRNNRRWDVSGISVQSPDLSNIESYIDFVLNAEGEDFIDPASAAEISFDYARIVVEFGNGTVITIRISDYDEVHKRYARVSNSTYTYVIPLWASLRLLRNADFFETE